MGSISATTALNMEKKMNPFSIAITEKEKAAGKLSPEHLLTAVVAIAEDGLVVLENAIEEEHLDAVNDQMLRDLKDLVERPTTHFNSKGNVSQVPPLTSGLMFEDIYANPFAGNVLEAILGPRPSQRYLNGNTALISDHRQHVHADLQWRHPHVPFALTISIYTVEATVENGATEFWLGSHRDTSWADHYEEGPVHYIKEEVLEARRKIRPPIQPHIPKCSLVVRDPRVWHAGTPNTTDHARPCLTMSYSPAWMNNKVKLSLPKEVEPLIASYKWNVDIAADYVDSPQGKFDYLSLDFIYDLSPWGGRSGEEKEKMMKDWVEQWGSRF